jgi:HEAT repeat protein
MSSRRNLLAVGCVLLAIILSLAVFFNSSTPSHEGKSISQWLEWFDSPSGLSQGQWQERLQRRVEATHALRQMGPEVFPHLRRMLKPDSGTTKFLYELRRQWKKEHVAAGSVVPPSPEVARMLRACEACSALGRDAQTMIPDLLRVMKSNTYSNVRSRAAYALGEVGGAPEVVVPALVQSLSNRTDGNVLISLGKYGADASTAVPSIAALLNGIETSVKEHTSFDRYFLCEAARALQQIDPREGEKTLPLLRQVLQEEHDPSWRSRLGELVNLIGSGAAPNSQEK